MSLADIDRVLSLSDWSKAIHRDVQLPVPKGDRQLLPSQQQALREMALAGGFFGTLPVGSGKTLIMLLAPLVLEAKNPLFLVEANYLPALELQVAEWQDEFDLPKFKVMSYELLSTKGHTYDLEKLKPDLIVADEGHNLKNMKSARTKRLVKYMINNPEVMFVTFSGTMTSRSLHEYAHLMELALRDRAPIPLSAMNVSKWARCTDPWSYALSQDPPQSGDWASIKRLWQWYNKECNHGDGLIDWRKAGDKERRAESRAALKYRLNSAAGCMLLETGSYDGALNLYMIGGGIPLEIKQARDQVVHEFGALDAHRHRTTLGQGFMYYWDWPNGVPDREFLQIRKMYADLIHHTMLEDEELDSPGMAHDSIKSHAVVHAWEAVRHRQPPTATLWISHWIIDDAIHRATSLLSKGKTIIWYEHKAQADAFREKGLTVYGEGDGAPEGDLVVLSRRVYGTGWNLQEYRNHIVLQFPSSGRAAEQLLGRAHRQGQTADSVDVYVYSHTPEIRKFLEQAMRDCRYMRQTHGTQTKLSVATIVQLEN